MMYTLTAWARPLDHPKVFLGLAFLAWKFILLCVALTAPGPGYDTSTGLLHSESDIAQFTSISQWVPTSYLNSLVRWDAIYFTQLAKRGYLWEQEWAFGWGFTNLITVTTQGDCYSISVASCEADNFQGLASRVTNGHSTLKHWLLSY